MILPLDFEIEKTEGKGEDTQPILDVFSETSGLIGVFDGLGGSGSTPYSRGDETYTGAQIASSAARSAVERYFQELEDKEQGFKSSYNPEDLEQSLLAELKKEASEYDTVASVFKGTLLQSLPTTMAMLYFEEANEGAYECRAIWAGDSRCYCLDPKQGLRQLTTDDIRPDGDALESIKNDFGMSNYVNSSAKFHVNDRVVTLEPPVLLIAATDGCFDYLFSPAHFERLLLNTLLAAEDIEEWKERLKGDLSEITGDDASLALVALGWPNFAALQKDFGLRVRIVEKTYTDPLDELNKRIRELEREKKEYERKVKKRRDELWEGYKQSYSEYLRTEGQQSDLLPGN